MVRGDQKRQMAKLRDMKVQAQQRLPKSKTIKKDKNNSTTNGVSGKNGQNGSHAQGNKRVPAIVTDIDGVLFKGKFLLGNSTKMVNALQQEMQFQSIGQAKLPFIFLTNGGGEATEAQKALSLTNKLQLDKKAEVKEQQMIICHTPLGQKQILDRYKDKIVLVDGVGGDVIKLALHHGYTKPVSLIELAAVYPDIVYSTRQIFEFKKKTREEYLSDLSKRLGIPENKLAKKLYISAIMLFNPPEYVGLAIQVFNDLIGSKDGHVLGQRRTKTDRQVVSVYFTNPDFTYADTWKFPRLGPLSFTIQSQATFKQEYGFGYKYEQMGKPTAITYSFCETVLAKKAKEMKVDITNTYMIGDNPKSDIAGANAKGWTSILVKTGVFNGKDQENDKEHPATHVVDDFEAAIKLIFEKEGLKLTNNDLFTNKL